MVKNKVFNNSNGLTLIEIMAVLAILSIIGILAANIVISSININSQQSAESKQITDSSYILKLITKDLRSTSSIDYKSNEYIFKDDTENPIATYTFNPTDKSLMRNSSQIANDIVIFKISDNSTYSVRIEFFLHNENYETDIAFRKGD